MSSASQVWGEKKHLRSNWAKASTWQVFSKNKLSLLLTFSECFILRVVMDLGTLNVRHRCITGHHSHTHQGQFNTAKSYYCHVIGMWEETGTDMGSCELAKIPEIKKQPNVVITLVCLIYTLFFILAT